MNNRIRFFIPIEKINKEQRTVSGWATTEKVDKQNEIVDYEASKKAFDDWHGNIREMHEAKAVGKAIDIDYDDATKRIYVTAKISRGAEDTWIKVKDGTLTGFSIGGQTIDKVQQIVKDDEETKQITRITKYRLNELSLVDNPANPEASFELVKSDGDGHLRQTSIVEDSGDKKVVKYTGGDTKTMALSKQVLGKLSTLLTQIDKIVKQDWEDPNAEVGTAKETPEGSNESHEDVSAGLGKQEGDWEDPNTEVAGSKDTPAGSTDSEEDVSAGVKKVRKARKQYNDEDETEKQDEEDETEKADMDTDPDSSLRTQEEEGHGAAPVKKRRKLYYKDANGEYHEMKKQDEDEDDTEKADMASNPDSNLRTQEEDEHGQANLATKRHRKAVHDEDEMDKQDEDEDTEKQDDDEEETMKTRKRNKRYSRKQYTAEGQPEHMDKEDDEEDTEKQDDEDDETEKTLVSTTLKKLVKRLDRLEKAPLPRKYRLIEKTPSAPTESEELQKGTDEVMAAIEESRRTGKPLPPSIEAKRDRILNKMIDKKFGQDLRKV